jgi:hypothetical protein
VKLNTSEIVLKGTYIDRLNNNKTKKADNTNIFSYSFTFQKAVQRLEDRDSVDLRILSKHRWNFGRELHVQH